MLKKIINSFNFQSIDYYVFIVLVFALPFGRSVFTPLLFLWLFLALISYFNKRDYSIVNLRDPLILLVVFYLIFALSSILSSSLKIGLNEMQFKLPLLLIPLLFPQKRLIYKQGFGFIINSFIIGCVASSVFIIGWAFYRSIHLINHVWVFNPTAEYGWNSNFLSTDFSLLIHPSYFSLFILISLLALGLYFNSWWKKSIWMKIAYMLSFAILVLTLILLQSRSGVISFMLMIMIWLLYLIFIKRKYILGLLFIIGIIFSVIAIAKHFNRFSQTVNSLKMAIADNNTNTKEDATTIRIWIWKSALSAIKENPVLGVGQYNVKEVLNKEYQNRNMQSAITMKLNAHNQFIETWLGMGILGLIVLLLMFIYPLRIGFIDKNWMLIGFTMLCGLSFIFESMLERIVGIVFFSLFYTILLSNRNIQSKT